MPLSRVDLPPRAGLEFLQVCQWSHKHLRMWLWGVVVPKHAFLVSTSCILGAGRLALLAPQAYTGAWQADGFGHSAGAGRRVCTQEHLLRNPFSGFPLP